MAKQSVEVRMILTDAEQRANDLENPGEKVAAAMLREGIAEIKAALEQAGLLSLAYDMLQVAVEHGVPDPSNHVRGSPDANCDVGCMNHAHFFQNVAVIRRAVNKEES